MKNKVFTFSDLPPGFRFLPEDEELINDYLIPKINGHDYPNGHTQNLIPEVDLCKVEPRLVPGFSIVKSKYPEWFFFSPVDYKYSNSKRVNRTTESGFWKSTGNDRKIKVQGTNDVIGTKKTLVYFEGRVPNGVKSNWVIHEYHAVTDLHQTQRGFVLCLLKRKAAEGGTDTLICDEGEPNSSGQMASSDHENVATEEENPQENPPVGALPGMHQEEIDLPPVDLSPIGTELEACSSAPVSPIGIELEACFSAHNAYFKNEDNVMQTSFEIIEEGNEFPAYLIPIHELGVEHETSLIRSPAHNTYYKNYDETIEEVNDFINLDLLLFLIQQSPIGTESEASFTNASFGNERCSIQIPFETIEGVNKFSTSIHELGVEHETSLIKSPAHNTYFKNSDETIDEDNDFINLDLLEASFTNASFGNERCSMQIPFETIEGVDKFSTPIQKSPFQTIETIEVWNECSTPIQKSIEVGNEFPTSIQKSQLQTIEGGEKEFTSNLTSIQKSQINIELVTSPESFPSQYTCLSNEDYLMQTPVVETIEEGNESLTSISAPRESEEEKEFLNSISANENFVPNKESGQVFVNNSTQTESLKRAYYGSYDTDAEVASTQNGIVVDISAMCNEHSSSDEYRASKKLKSTQGSIGGGIHLFSSYQDANNEESILQNDFWGVDFWGVETSCDSTTDKPFESNRDEISS